MPIAKRKVSRSLTYCAAVIAIVLATVLRMFLAPVVGAGFPFATYFVATVLVAWYFGFGEAILSILLSAGAGSYFFVSPSTTSPFFFGSRTDRVTVLGFIFGSLGVAFLIHLQRRTLERLRDEVVRRRTAEDAEREQRHWFETTLASIGDAVIATDTDRKVTFMNTIASQLTGWNIQQARGSPLSDVFRIVNEETGAEVESPVDTVIKKGLIVGLANHTVLISKDGRRIPLDDSGAPIKQEGQTVGAVLVFRDVTQRRNTQLQIERAERNYRLLFESNPQPMWVYDRKSLAFLAVNKAAVQQYGYSAEQFLNMTLKDIRPAEDVPALLEDVQRSTMSLHRDGPWRHRKRDGSIISVEISAHPIEYEGRNACLVLATDVTERKKMEEQFHQAQRLESIGRLAGGIAHDFNNLLTVINGCAGEMLSEVPANSPVGRRVTEISAAGERAAALTKQLLAFSRKQPIEPRVVNLNDVMAELEPMLRRLIGENIELIVSPSQNLDNVRADAAQIQQAIVNLAVNARDAMPHGGSLTLTTSNAFLDSDYCTAHPEVLPGAYVMFAITDTGVGMTPEIQQQVFEPFFTTKPMGAGTGLGLATVHGTVRQSGGSIALHSQPSVGTTFRIYLPRTTDSVPQRTAINPADPHGTETILVVEDQEDVRAVAVRALERYGYRVLSAASGQEAIELANAFQEKIDLLITDMVMPGMDGHTLAQHISAGRTLRVLLMSGYTETAVPIDALDRNFGYIPKPFTPLSLASKVRDVLQH